MQPLAYYGPPTMDAKAEGWFEPKSPRLAWVSRETLSENLSKCYYQLKIVAVKNEASFLRL